MEQKKTIDDERLMKSYWAVNFFFIKNYNKLPWVYRSTSSNCWTHYLNQIHESFNGLGRSNMKVTNIGLSWVIELVGQPTLLIYIPNYFESYTHGLWWCVWLGKTFYVRLRSFVCSLTFLYEEWEAWTEGGKWDQVDLVVPNFQFIPKSCFVTSHRRWELLWLSSPYLKSLKLLSAPNACCFQMKKLSSSSLMETRRDHWKGWVSRFVIVRFSI